MSTTVVLDAVDQLDRPPVSSLQMPVIIRVEDEEDEVKKDLQQFHRAESLNVPKETRKGDIVMDDSGDARLTAVTTKEKVDDPIDEQQEVKEKEKQQLQPKKQHEQQNRYVSPKDFEYLKVVGMGAFGKVLQVRNKHTNKVFAMKVISKRLLRRKNGYVENIHAERNILTKVRHPFVVTMHCSFQTREKLFIIMDFLAGGELFLRLGREGIFLEKTAAFYLAEIILALDHLHTLGILHRDLKPENVLLGSDGHVCLTDFGLAKDCSSNVHGGGTSFQPREDGGDEDETTRALTVCGTKEYMAPEMIARQGYGRAADYWSLGCIAYEMLSGRPPFESRAGNKDLFKKIMSEKVKMPDGTTPAAHKLLKGLLNRNVQSRLGTARSTMFEVGGVAGLKKAEFFKHIDWEKLEARQIDPPHDAKLSVSHDEDLTHFHADFTNMALPRSVIEMTKTEWKARRIESQQFRGFSFVQEDFDGVPERDEEEIRSYWDEPHEDGESESDCASSKCSFRDLMPQLPEPSSAAAAIAASKKKKQNKKNKKAAAASPVKQTASTTPTPAAAPAADTTATTVESSTPPPYTTNGSHANVAISVIKNPAVVSPSLSKPIAAAPTPPPPKKFVQEQWQGVSTSNKKKEAKKPIATTTTMPVGKGQINGGQQQQGKWATVNGGVSSNGALQHPVRPIPGQAPYSNAAPTLSRQPNGQPARQLPGTWGNPQGPRAVATTTTATSGWPRPGIPNGAGPSTRPGNGASAVPPPPMSSSSNHSAQPSSDWRQHHMSPSATPKSIRTIALQPQLQQQPPLKAAAPVMSPPSWPSLSATSTSGTAKSKVVLPPLVSTAPAVVAAAAPPPPTAKLQGAWASRVKR